MLQHLSPRCSEDTELTPIHSLIHAANSFHPRILLQAAATTNQRGRGDEAEEQHLGLEDRDDDDEMPGRGGGDEAEEQHLGLEDRDDDDEMPGRGGGDEAEEQHLGLEDRDDDDEMPGRGGGDEAEEQHLGLEDRDDDDEMPGRSGGDKARSSMSTSWAWMILYLFLTRA
ncbi:hypothetical protein TcWFU_003630 [Taenia crassiceps]|uniref:Uncharacterized protein n=1 Tax=Taenia crassiceps TaxID=6207 RepID=A0ABR4QAU1_9CEST